MPLIIPANTLSDAGYSVANSCRFNNDDSAYMHKTPAGAGTSNTTFTLSVWVKRSDTATAIPRLFEFYNTSNYYISLRFRDDVIQNLDFYSESNGGSVNLRTNRGFRDVGAWYHIVMRVDTTNGTADDRLRMYVNGVQETSFAARTNPGSSEDLNFNGANDVQYVGRKWEDSDYFDGYMAEVCYCDGQSLAPTSFGEFDEDSPTIWKPIDVSGLTFGTNGFYLDFEDSSNLGNDANGGTDLTEVNLAATDQATDTPTNNFCTLNSVASSIDTTNNVLKEGNLIVDHGDSGLDGGVTTFGFLASQSGKWYWEIEVNADSGSGNQGEFAGINYIGGASATGYDDFGIESHLLATTGSNIIYKKDNSAVFTITSPAGFSAGDHLNVALDLDNNKIWFGLNGTFYDMADGSTDGDPAGNSGGATVSRDYDYLPYYRVGGSSAQLNFNFGNPPTGFAIASGNQDPNGYGNFEYPTQGFYSLCTKNLAEYG